MGTSQLQNDIPVEVRGYVTDPKRVGYQILTNYESLYWRCLVGHEAWSLYELLRTFCHDGNTTCHPSINLLLAVLGLKERRVLTGRITIVNGAEYRYPGLIDGLQDHQLIVAEVTGEGTETRYVYHVNLTPGLLTDEQVSQLPPLLQKKHAELIERCQKSIQKLEIKRRTPKVNLNESKELKSSDSPEGGVWQIARGGYGKLPEGSGKLPPEQHPVNTTHKTTTVTPRDLENNNSGGEPEPPPADVVAALRQIGLSDKVAQRLAQRYNRERILEKIEYLTFLQKAQTKKVTNPRGWLRRAIEEDYATPDGYKSKEERQQKVQELARTEAENERYYEELRAQREQEQEKALAELRKTYGTTPKELDLWAQALAEIEVSTTQPNFQAWFPQTQLLSLKDGVAVIGVPNKHTQEWLEHRLNTIIKRVLDGLVGHSVTLSFAVLESQEANKLQQQHRVPQMNTTSV